MKKKGSLRPNNSLEINNSSDYISSPEKSSPEKLISTDSKYIPTNKAFKQAINKYQNHIVEENDDEEENDKFEENLSPLKVKSSFYNTNDGNSTNEPMSMSLLSDSKEKQIIIKTKNLEKKAFTVAGKAFKPSNILNDKESNILYMNLPGVLLYETELIFSLTREKNFENLEKILQNHKCSIVVLLSFGSEKFGGYASESWDLQKARYF